MQMDPSLLFQGVLEEVFLSTASSQEKNPVAKLSPKPLNPPQRDEHQTTLEHHFSPVTPEDQQYFYPQALLLLLL